jgi:hypothetical protein
VIVPPPYENIAGVSVIYNEERRVAPLTATLGTWFDEVVVVVQKSTDKTLDIARKILNAPTHKVIEDAHRGAGDFSMPTALAAVTKPWVFVLSGDEMPDIELLRSLPDLTTALERDGLQGAFIEFEEKVDGVPYIEHGRHVRVFRPEGGWEARLHSAASHDRVGIWPIGVIHHERSLSELIIDYLGYLAIAERDGDAGLVDVNRATIMRACETVAESKGWAYVRGLKEWPMVEQHVLRYLRTDMDIL